jgi:hypothetical protein
LCFVRPLLQCLGAVAWWLFWIFLALGCPAVIVQFVQLMCNCSIVCRFGYDAIDAIMTQFNLAYKMPLLPFVRLVLLVVYQLILLSLLLLFLLKRHLMSDSRCWLVFPSRF